MVEDEHEPALCDVAADEVETSYGIHPIIRGERQEEKWDASHIPGMEILSAAGHVTESDRLIDGLALLGGEEGGQEVYHPVAGGIVVESAPHENKRYLPFREWEHIRRLHEITQRWNEFNGRVR